MRILFLGASGLGKACCRALLEDGQQVVGIATIPQEFEISWSSALVRNAQFTDFSDLALEYNLPVHAVTSGRRSALQPFVETCRPDLLVVIGWYFMLPQSITRMVPLGAVGVHASLLPKYRGGAPLVWAIIRGEVRTGVSLFHLGEGVDNGDLIAQRAFEIDQEDDIASVLEKARQVSIDVVRVCIPGIADGTATRVPQDEREATSVPQRTPEDGVIDWRISSREVHNWVRAQTRPYPGAFSWMAGLRVRIWHTELVSPIGQAPGRVVPGRYPVVACADGEAIRLLDFEIEGPGSGGMTNLPGESFADAVGTQTCP